MADSSTQNYFGNNVLRPTEPRSAGRLEFAREPTRSISFQGIYGETRFLDAVAGAALKGTFFIAALARRNSG
jgi:hypothetical protein